MNRKCFCSWSSCKILEKALAGTLKREYLDQALPTQLKGNNELYQSRTQLCHSSFNRNVLIWLQASTQGIHREHSTCGTESTSGRHQPRAGNAFQLSTPPKAALGRSSKRRGSLSSCWAEQWRELRTKPCRTNTAWAPLPHPPAALWQLFWWGESRVPPPAGPAESNWWSRKLLLWFSLYLLSLKVALLSLWPGKTRIKK